MRAFQVAVRTIKGGGRALHSQVCNAGSPTDVGILAARGLLLQHRCICAGTAKRAGIRRHLGRGGPLACARARGFGSHDVAGSAQDLCSAQISDRRARCASVRGAALRLLFDRLPASHSHRRGAHRRCHYPGTNAPRGGIPGAGSIPRHKSPGLCAGSNHGTDLRGSNPARSLHRRNQVARRRCAPIPVSIS